MIMLLGDFYVWVSIFKIEKYILIKLEDWIKLNVAGSKTQFIETV